MAPADHHATRWRRAPAATRVVGDQRFVCRTGWHTDVQRLSGAARIVWEVLESVSTTEQIADLVGVGVDDPFLNEALRMLNDSALVERIDQ